MTTYNDIPSERKVLSVLASAPLVGYTREQLRERCGLDQMNFSMAVWWLSIWAKAVAYGWDTKTYTLTPRSEKYLQTLDKAEAKRKKQSA